MRAEGMTVTEYEFITIINNFLIFFIQGIKPLQT